MNKITAIIGVVVVAVLAFFGFSQYRNEPEDSDTADNTQSPPPSLAASPTQSTVNSPTASPTPRPGTTTQPPSSRKYKDGTYSAQGTYRSPAMQETIDIRLTIKDDKIVSADFTGNGTNPTTIKMQGQFSAGYEQVVEGKNVDEVSLTVVNGSSLTPKGFMDALAKIKVQAQS